MTYSELPAITNNTPTNLVAEIIQQQQFINTYTNPEGCHVTNFIRQNEDEYGKKATQSSTATSGRV